MTDKTTHFTCRRAAVFSDLHSNYHAFRACYEDAKSHGSDLFIFLGDYISDLADPVKTLDLVYEIQKQYPVVFLRGNRERYMLECDAGITAFTRGSKSGSLLYTFERLRPQDLDFFRDLPIYDRIEINGVSFELAHAFKTDDRCYFEGGDERIADIFSQMEAPYLLTGHSHRQYVQKLQCKTIINPGSVGVPVGVRGLAQYALLDIHDQRADYLLRSVPFDLASVVHAQFHSGLTEYAKYWAISILYDVITGEERTMKLLETVSRIGDVQDEGNWRKAAMAMDMKFTAKELIEII